MDSCCVVLDTPTVPDSDDSSYPLTQRDPVVKPEVYIVIEYYAKFTGKSKRITSHITTESLRAHLSMVTDDLASGVVINFECEGAENIV